MDPVDRLAAYVAGDLDADEHAALEAELARDPVLRGQLDALLRADEALTEVRSPEASPGFEARLHQALDAVLEDELGPAVVDELASRREARSKRGWAGQGLGWPRLLVGGAAAAAILVVGGLVLGTGGPFGSDEAAEDHMAAMDSDDAGEPGIESFASPYGDAPTIVAAGRQLDDADLDALRDSDQLALRELGLDGAAGQELAATFQAALGSADAAGSEGIPGSDDGGMDAADAGQESAADDADEDAAGDAGDADEDAAGDAEIAEEGDGEQRQRALPELRTADGTLVSVADREVIARCLDELLSGGRDAIPVYVELATYQDADAVVFGLVTPDPATEAYTRSEMWVLDAATCQVLRFSQR